jgi:hypothetical protein
MKDARMNDGSLTNFGAPLRWLLWIFFNALGSTIAGVYANAVILFGILVVAVPMSIMQWVVLRIVCRGVAWWVPATIVGAIFGWAIASSTHPLIKDVSFNNILNTLQGRSAGSLLTISYLIDFTIVGVCIGLLQSHILRNITQYYIWWIVISTIGYVMFALLYAIMSPVYFAMAGIVYALVTGIWLDTVPKKYQRGI